MDFEKLILMKAISCGPEKANPQLLKNDSTKLLRMQNSLPKATEELEKKRKEVKYRKEALKGKWHKFEKKQKVFHEKVNSHSQTIEEGEIMRCKTLQRARVEMQRCQKKEKVVNALRKELEDLKLRCKEKASEVQMKKPIQTFLEATQRKAPNGYFDQNVKEASSVMRRYQSLWSNHKYLQHRMTNSTDLVLKGQVEMKQLHEKHQHAIAVINTQISDLTKQLEQHKHRNILLEEKFHKSQLKKREKNEQLYSIVLAIENLSMICENNMPKLKSKASSSKNPIVSKLQQIEDFLIHKSAVVEHAKMLIKDEFERRVNSGDGGSTTALVPAKSLPSSSDVARKMSKVAATTTTFDNVNII